MVSGVLRPSLSLEYIEAVSQTDDRARSSLSRAMAGGEGLKYCSEMSGELDIFTKGASVSGEGDGRSGGDEGKRTLILPFGSVFGFCLFHDLMSSRREPRLDEVEASSPDDLCRNLNRDERLDGGELPLLLPEDGSRADCERATPLGVDGDVGKLVAGHGRKDVT